MPQWMATGAMLGVLGVGACGADQPPVCDSLAAVQNSVAQLRNANVSENGLSHLKTNLDQLTSNLQQLSTTAQAQFGSDVQAVRTAVNQFSTSLTTARATPDANTLAAVRTSLTTVQDSVRQLGDAMGGTC